MRPSFSRLWRAALAACALLSCAAPAVQPSSRVQATAAAPGYLLALNKAEATLAIIDPAKMRVVGRAPTGDGPHEVATSTDGRTAYVAVTVVGKPDPGRVVRIDLEKMEIAGSVETGQALDGLGWVGK